MTTTLVLPTEIADDLEAAARLNVETAGVLLARVAKAPNSNMRMLAQRIRWVSESAYVRREVDGLTIASDGYVHALGEAEELGATCVWLHTHPGYDAIPRASHHDHIVDRQLSDVFRLRSGSPYFGSLIISPRPTGVSFTGCLQTQDEVPIALDRLWRVGDRWQLTRSFDSPLRELAEIFDRNVRAFGPGIPETLRDLQVGLVGCGGTGSAVAEQLVRLGVRHLLLIDPERLTSSNLTRVYGSKAAQVGVLKVEAL